MAAREADKTERKCSRVNGEFPRKGKRGGADITPPGPNPHPLQLGLLTLARDPRRPSIGTDDGLVRPPGPPILSAAQHPWKRWRVCSPSRLGAPGTKGDTSSAAGALTPCEDLASSDCSVHLHGIYLCLSNIEVVTRT